MIEDASEGRRSNADQRPRLSADNLTSVTSQWAAVPMSHLRRELARRQADGERPACGSGARSRTYNVPAHVAALFLILFLSTLACSFPIIVRRFPKLPIPNFTLFISRHFGTGVLIATAFVHLLPTAYTNLTDPCLPRFWNEVYPAMAGFIAMVSVLLVVGVEMFFATKGGGHSHHVDFDQLKRGPNDTRTAHRPDYRRSGSFKRFRQEPFGVAEDEIPLTEQSSPYSDVSTPTHPDAASVLNKPLPHPPSGGEDDDSDLDLDELDDPLPEEAQPLTGQMQSSASTSGLQPNGHVRNISRKVSFADPPSTTPGEAVQPGPNAAEQRMILQCLLLEAGILFHSVFIGMAVSVSTGSAFVVLLVAISFHQTFEGLALGSRIAAIPTFTTTSPKPWLMSLMYGITTPIGQAIGLALQGLYDPESQLGLLMVGIVNAISSGLLLYAGLVQLLAEDFLSDQSYVDLHGMRRLQACAAVVAGSMLMAFVGAFA